MTHNVCLQIVKVFRLEPKVRGLEAADKKTESPVKEELSAVKKADRFRELTNLYGTKKARNEVSPLPLPLRLYNTIKSILKKKKINKKSIDRCIWDFNWHLMI